MGSLVHTALVSRAVAGKLHWEVVGQIFSDVADDTSF